MRRVNGPGQQDTGCTHSRPGGEDTRAMAGRGGHACRGRAGRTRVQCGDLCGHLLEPPCPTVMVSAQGWPARPKIHTVARALFPWK